MEQVELHQVFDVLSCGSDVVTLESIARALGPVVGVAAVMGLDLGLTEGQAIHWPQFQQLIGRHTDARLRSAGHVAFRLLLGKGYDPHAPMLGSDRLCEAFGNVEAFTGPAPADIEDAKAVLRRTTGGAPMSEETFQGCVRMSFPAEEQQESM